MHETIYAVPVSELSDKQRAVAVDGQIKANIAVASTALLEIAQGLKNMRDHRLYIYIGYEDFESYVDGELHFSRRHAYNFIGVLENLGEDFVKSNAQLGITKLNLLAQLTKSERAEVMEENNVEDVSSRALQELVREKQGLEEALAAQTSLFDTTAVELRQLKATIREEQAKIHADADAKIEAARKKSERDLESAKKRARAEADAKIKAELAQMDKNAAAEKQRMEQTVKAESEARLRKLQAELAAEKQRAEELARKSAAADVHPDALRFDVYFLQLQQCIEELRSAVEGVRKDDEDFALRLEDALRRFLAAKAKEDFE